MAYADAQIARGHKKHLRGDFAVALLRFGYSEQIVADHEGHKNTTLVRERYGRFKPTKHDYAKGATVHPIKARGRKHG